MKKRQKTLDKVKITGAIICRLQRAEIMLNSTEGPISERKERMIQL
jgi:hypothetical protein